MRGLSTAKSRTSKYVLAENTVLNRAKKINGCDIEILKNRAIFKVSHDSQQRSPNHFTKNQVFYYETKEE